MLYRYTVEHYSVIKELNPAICATVVGTGKTYIDKYCRDLTCSQHLKSHLLGFGTEMVVLRFGEDEKAEEGWQWE